MATVTVDDDVYQRIQRLAAEHHCSDAQVVQVAISMLENYDSGTNIPHYSVIIEWSAADNCYVVTLPEWSDQYRMPIAQGNTIEEAAIRGNNAIQNYIWMALQDGKSLPARSSLDKLYGSLAGNPLPEIERE